MMNENAKKWVEALRSGRFRQHIRSLANRDRTKHCCLGVACEVAIENGVKVTVVKCEADDMVAYDGNMGYIPPVVCDWLGIKSGTGWIPSAKSGDGTDVSLSGANDAGMSFDKIADLIERYQDRLFEQPAPKAR